jgi:hypothetical protein
VIVAVNWADPGVVAAIVAGITAVGTTLLAIVSSPLRYQIEKRALLYKLNAEYEYEQRRELRHLIGRHQGRLLEAAEAWNNRMNNLYEHEAEGRLAAHGRYEEPNYYLRSTAYRFLTLCSLARNFEAQAFYIDVRIAEAGDLDFVKFTKAFRWLMTDLDVVAGLEYEPWEGADHFYNDRFRGICDSFRNGDEVLSLAEFEDRAAHDPNLVQVLAFLDGLRADEPRLRWDRLVALHLLVMAFLNAFGYDMQRSTDDDLKRAVDRVVRPEVRTNLIAAVSKLGLAGNAEVQRVVRVLREAGAAPPEAGERPQTRQLAGVPEHRG